MLNTTKGVIILGSSRSQGNTAKIVRYFQEKTGFDLIDLQTKKIQHYSYENEYINDDFQSLFHSIATEYDRIIFATPVYWYSMSGRLKVFFDRITDFLQNDQETVKRLTGKQMAVISCSNSEEINEGFEVPFKETAAYLGMEYKGHCHTWLENNTIPESVKEELKNLDRTIKT